MPFHQCSRCRDIIPFINHGLSKPAYTSTGDVMCQSCSVKALHDAVVSASPPLDLLEYTPGWSPNRSVYITQKVNSVVQENTHHQKCSMCTKEASIDTKGASPKEVLKPSGPLPCRCLTCQSVLCVPHYLNHSTTHPGHQGVVYPPTTITTTSTTAKAQPLIVGSCVNHPHAKLDQVDIDKLLSLCNACSRDEDGVDQDNEGKKKTEKIKTNAMPIEKAAPILRQRLVDVLMSEIPWGDNERKGERQSVPVDEESAKQCNCHPRDVSSRLPSSSLMKGNGNPHKGRTMIAILDEMHQFGRVLSRTMDRIVSINDNMGRIQTNLRSLKALATNFIVRRWTYGITNELVVVKLLYRWLEGTVKPRKDIFATIAECLRLLGIIKMDKGKKETVNEMDTQNVGSSSGSNSSGSGSGDKRSEGNVESKKTEKDGKGSAEGSDDGDDNETLEAMMRLTKKDILERLNERPITAENVGMEVKVLKVLEGVKKLLMGQTSPSSSLRIDLLSLKEEDYHKHICWQIDSVLNVIESFVMDFIDRTMINDTYDNAIDNTTYILKRAREKVIKMRIAIHSVVSLVRWLGDIPSFMHRYDPHRWVTQWVSMRDDLSYKTGREEGGKRIRIQITKCLTTLVTEMGTVEEPTRQVLKQVEDIMITGHPDAFLLKGILCYKFPREAYIYFLVALYCGSTNPYLYYFLGKCYTTGNKGVPKDIDRAYHYYNKAIEGGLLLTYLDLWHMQCECGQATQDTEFDYTRNQRHDTYMLECCMQGITDNEILARVTLANLNKTRQSIPTLKDPTLILCPDWYLYKLMSWKSYAPAQQDKAMLVFNKALRQGIRDTRLYASMFCLLRHPHYKPGKAVLGLFKTKNELCLHYADRLVDAGWRNAGVLKSFFQSPAHTYKAILDAAEKGVLTFSEHQDISMLTRKPVGGIKADYNKAIVAMINSLPFCPTPRDELKTYEEISGLYSDPSSIQNERVSKVYRRLSLDILPTYALRYKAPSLRKISSYCNLDFSDREDEVEDEDEDDDIYDTDDTDDDQDDSDHFHRLNGGLPFGCHGHGDDDDDDDDGDGDDNAEEPEPGMDMVLFLLASMLRRARHE